MRQITPTGHARAKWNGAYEGDSKLSTQQIAALGRLGLDRHSTSCTKVKVRWPREPNAAERAAWKPRETCFDEDMVSCPIIQSERKRLLVITPGGDQHWIAR